MKNLQFIAAITLAVLLGAVATCLADEQKSEKAKPYPLNTCLVCGEKFHPMGEPYAFVYNGREIKLCCPADKAAFDKDPAKYVKQLDDAEARIKKQP